MSEPTDFPRPDTSPDGRLLAARAEQTRRWRGGLPVLVEELLVDYPDLAQRPDDVLVLICGEVMLRTERGEVPSLAEYRGRFPALAESLQMSFALVGALAASQAPTTPSGAGEGEPTDDVPLEVPGYRLVRPVGRGGMGVVYEAEDLALGRPVALKFLKEPLAGLPAAEERFRREVAVTARLQHPGVVPIYAAAPVAGGRACYVMRLVEGESLAEAIGRLYSPRPPEGRPRLTLRQLLERFVAVCRTVAYAHSKGVIHRDLKPANIMLGDYGETLVLDWGLARIVGLPDVEPGTTPAPAGASETQTGEVLGTPAFASPEQAEGRREEVGPQSDVYSLGAVLYAILTGRSPYRGSGVDILAQVRAGALVPPREVNPDVPRPLDALVRQAMAPRSVDRPAGALALAAEVERWLADEALLAYRDPIPARLARWGRRHQTLVATSSALVVATLLATAIGAVLLGAERERTLMAAHEAEIRNRESETSRRNAAEVAGLLSSIFRSPDPFASQRLGFRDNPLPAAEMSARQLLDAGTREVEQKLADQPAVQAALFDSLGNSYRGLGVFDRARDLLTRGLEARRRLYGDSHAEVATSLNSLAWLDMEMGRYAEADQGYRRALEMRLQHLGPDDVAVAETRFHLATLLIYQPYAPVPTQPANLPEAEQLLRASLAVRQARLGPQHPDTLLTLFALSAVRFAQGAQDEARAMLQEGLERQQQPDGDQALARVVGRFLLAERLRLQGQHREAAQIHAEVLQTAGRFLGRDHLWYGVLLANYAGTLRQIPDMAAAERAGREALAILRRYPVRSHPFFLGGLSELADLVRNRNELGEAEKLYREVLEYGKEKAPGSEPVVKNARAKLISLLRSQNREAEAQLLEP